MSGKALLRHLKRLWPLLLVIAVLAAAWALGAGHLLTWHALAQRQAQLRALVATRPAETAAAYVALYALAVAISLPGGLILTASGGLLFGGALGAALAVTGASIGAIVLFLLARYAFAGILQARTGGWMARIRPGLERDGFSYLLAIRLVPIFPFWLVNLAPALAGMRLAPYALATVIGIAPASAVIAFIGAGIGDVLAQGKSPDLSLLVSLPVLGPLVALALLSLAPVAWRRWKARHA